MSKKNILIGSLLLNIIFIIIYFILEYDRASLRGVYYGNKCWYLPNDKEYEESIYHRLELNYDGTFQFSSKNKTDILNGEWKRLEKNKILFIGRNFKDEAKINKHNIYFSYTIPNDSISSDNLTIVKAHRCHTYNGGEKKWWSSFLGLLYIVVFVISILITINQLLKKEKKCPQHQN